MSATVTKLPTAATSFYLVRRYGRQWFLYLVTPCEGGKPIKTKLGSHPRREAMFDYARQLGERLHRPVKLPEAPP